MTVARLARVGDGVVVEAVEPPEPGRRMRGRRAQAAAAHAATSCGESLLRFCGDRAVERWNRLDDIAFLSQIGAMPVPSRA